MNTYAQSGDFMPGYFIDDAGNRIDCYIRNEDKLTNPTQLEYKLSAGGEKQTATIQQVQYFEITNTTSAYERHTVKIDKSSSNLRELSGRREPEFVEETLFLRVIIKGKASLYSYHTKSVEIKFFIKTEQQPIEQLINKKYLAENSSTAVQNQAYKQQLWAALPCSDFNLETFEKVRYSEAELRKVFIKYNECVTAGYVNFAQYKSKGEFNFGPRVGASIGRMRFSNYGKYATHIGNSINVSPQIGLDLAYVLPFNRGKSSLFFQPTFQQYRGEAEIRAFGRDVVIDATYNYITLPLGIRRDVYASGNSKLHLSFSGVQHVLLNNEEPIQFDVTMNAGSGFKFYEPSITFMFGAGYTFNNKYVVEAAYQTPRQMSSNGYWNVKLVNAFSLQVGVRLK